MKGEAARLWKGKWARGFFGEMAHAEKLSREAEWDEKAQGALCPFRFSSLFKTRIASWEREDPPNPA